MKNVREILLQRRASATPALDAVRARALSSLPRTNPPTLSCLAAWLLEWRSLFREHRVAWAALSCSWLVIGWCQLAERPAAQTPHAAVRIRLSPAALASASLERRALWQGEEATPLMRSQPSGPSQRPRSDYANAAVRGC